MAKLKITIDMDNAAFGEDAGERLVEVGAILEKWIAKCDSHEEIVECTLRDSNGNTVGRVLVVE